MLEDRDYMRQPESRTASVSFTMVLLIVNAVVFLIQMATANLPNGLELQNQYFALSLEGLRHGYVWQLFTFQFMHMGWLHILFNSLAIYFFGRTVETSLGSHRFLGLYFLSGVAGGLVQMLFAWAVGDAYVPVVGASAGASGLIAAFAALNWTEPFTLILYFVPVTMKGRTLLWVSLALAAVGVLDVHSQIANAAHLGGLLAGYLGARQIIQGGLPQWRNPFSRPVSRRKAFVAAAHHQVSWRVAQPEEETGATDSFIHHEVDPILEKISAQGIQSLTSRERAILEAARKKMK